MVKFSRARYDNQNDTLPVLSNATGHPPPMSRGQGRSGGGAGGRRGRRGGRRLRRRVSAPWPAMPIPFRVLRDEARLLPEQLHRQHVRGHHDDHGNVEGDQRAEHEERPVVYHARVWSRHDVQGVDYTCEGNGHV